MYKYKYSTIVQTTSSSTMTEGPTNEKRGITNQIWKKHKGKEA